MRSNIENFEDPIEAVVHGTSPTPFARIRFAAGVFGVAVAAAMLLWLPLGLLGLLPSMIDVFGIAGLRIPAGAAIGGLLLAAIGFDRF